MIAREQANERAQNSFCVTLCIRNFVIIEWTQNFPKKFTTFNCLNENFFGKFNDSNGNSLFLFCLILIRMGIFRERNLIFVSFCHRYSWGAEIKFAYGSVSHVLVLLESLEIIQRIRFSDIYSNVFCAIVFRLKKSDFLEHWVFCQQTVLVIWFWLLMSMYDKIALTKMHQKRKCAFQQNTRCFHTETIRCAIHK